MAFRFLIFIGIFLTGCTGSVCETDEVLRLPSPDGEAYVSVTTKNCGATTSTTYLISLAGEGQGEDDVFRADKAKGIDIFWDDNGTLHIAYEEARIFFFTNFWQRMIDDDEFYQVNIIEYQKK